MSAALTLLVEKVAQELLKLANPSMGWETVLPAIRAVECEEIRSVVVVTSRLVEQSVRDAIAADLTYHARLAGEDNALAAMDLFLKAAHIARTGSTPEDQDRKDSQ